MHQVPISLSLQSSVNSVQLSRYQLHKGPCTPLMKDSQAMKVLGGPGQLQEFAINHLVDIVGCMLLNVAHPVPDVVEGGLICHIIDQEDAHGSSVVCCTYVIKHI